MYSFISISGLILLLPVLFINARMCVHGIACVHVFHFVGAQLLNIMIYLQNFRDQDRHHDGGCVVPILFVRACVLSYWFNKDQIYYLQQSKQ